MNTEEPVVRKNNRSVLPLTIEIDSDATCGTCSCGAIYDLAQNMPRSKDIRFVICSSSLLFFIHWQTAEMYAQDESSSGKTAQCISK